MGHTPHRMDPIAGDHDVWTGKCGRALWEGHLMSGAVAEAVGGAREVPYELVSAGVLVLEHLCRLDLPMYMTWYEMIAAWPALRHYSTAKDAWAVLRRDLEMLGVEPVEGHRRGGRPASNARRGHFQLGG